MKYTAVGHPINQNSLHAVSLSRRKTCDFRMHPELVSHEHWCGMKTKSKLQRKLLGVPYIHGVLHADWFNKRHESIRYLYCISDILDLNLKTVFFSIFLNQSINIMYFKRALNRKRSLLGKVTEVLCNKSTHILSVKGSYWLASHKKPPSFPSMH